MKKFIAPVIITVIIILYYVFFFAIVALLPGIPSLFRILLGIVPLVLAGVCIFVCIERCKEIRSGEEDDLSKY